MTNRVSPKIYIDWSPIQVVEHGVHVDQLPELRCRDVAIPEHPRVQRSGCDLSDECYRLQQIRTRLERASRRYDASMVCVNHENTLLLEDEMLEETVRGLLLNKARDLFKQPGRS